MANSFSYKPSSILLSSQIGDILIKSSNDFVDLKISGYGDVTILEERYYTFNGQLTIYNLASLIEDNMRSAGYTYSDYTLTVATDGADTDTMTLHVLYCDRYTVCNDVETFCSENFLTTLATRRIEPNFSVQLYMLVTSGDSTELKVNYEYRLTTDETIRRDSFSFNPGTYATKTEVKTMTIKRGHFLLNAVNSAGVSKNSIEILSFTVTCGQRCAAFFIDKSLKEARQFAFRNCFNVIEVATLRSVTTAKTDVDRTEAIVNGVSSFYNQTASKTYEVEANGLTAGESEWIDQLLTSHEVMTYVSNPCNDTDTLLLTNVLITDMTCEMQDGDDKLNSVKFTWRFADNRPFVHLSASPGIFSSPYNIVYS